MVLMLTRRQMQKLDLMRVIPEGAIKGMKYHYFAYGEDTTIWFWYTSYKKLSLSKLEAESYYLWWRVALSVEEVEKIVKKGKLVV